MSEAPSRNVWVLFGQLTAVAWEFLCAIVAGAVLGYLVDRELRSQPWGLIALTLLGTCTGLYRMVTLLRQLEKRGQSRDDG